MAEDWRIRVDLEDDGSGDRWSADDLVASELAEDVGRELGHRVAVSHDDRVLFLYADSEEAARATETVVRADFESHGWVGRVELTRWHDQAEEWKPADVPLPATAAQRAAEYEERVENEDEETAEEGYSSWEVRVDLPSHRDARALAKRLESDGVKPVRRWKYLFVGAADEEAAREWAEQLRTEVPAGSKVTVEATFASVERNNPFAFFGAGSGEG